jgi:hypothetical protein
LCRIGQTVILCALTAQVNATRRGRVLGVEVFRAGFQSGDIEAIIADLAPDFAFFHTGLAEPTTDVERLRLVLELARETIGEDFRFTEHMQGDGLHALRWTSTIDGVAAEGVDIVLEDADGRLLEVRIQMRPAAASEAWSRAMREHLGRLA